MSQADYQHTLKTGFTVEGVGVHSGATATLKVRPAPADHGIVFVRTDIQDKPNIIPALWDKVSETRLCTVLTNTAGVSISTVEHLISALAASGIDNAIIDIDGPEIPIMDGSAIAFLRQIDSVGTLRQQAPRKALRIKKLVSYQEGDKEVFLSPADGTYFGFELVYEGTMIGRQKLTHHLTPDNYRKDIATARTFGFLHEVEMLRKMGFARGGSLDNAVVIGKDEAGADKVLNPGGLRFKNEFVRHKILDAIGDIYLAGMPLIGHYHGVRAGHAMNNRILHVLFSQKDAYEIVELGKAQRSAPVSALAALSQHQAHVTA